MDEAIAEQIEYYRERAGEYDEWWVRRGQYALPPELERQWFHDVAQAETALRDFAPTGRVLELACGTGLWTRHLVGHAQHVTAVDASPEVIEHNRERLAGAPLNIEYVVADLFDWQPPSAAYDVVMFTYWLSHVPDDRLAEFWSGVRTALKPGGRAFVIDSTSPSPQPSGGRPEQRQLADGRQFTVLKRYWSVDELESDLRSRGWSPMVYTTDNQMILVATAATGPERAD
ncbi:class I SAM-dependent methyltransferase [Kribbella sp. NBC_00889]|uniref:class I SAM-dependent methyltransferase n=1 Tax=Kribbella sp. NBC_00889 TaxID=2975974 RepID=UPI00386FA602|nr:methyltransferase domain-containing protein [Kribbella sp. NBC_00889]